ncbi:MAG: CpsD/CapB family tyrosine-protein kinase [Candidatus Acidiferrales bacterium]
MSRIHDALKKAEEEKAANAGSVATSSEPERAGEVPHARRPLFAGDSGMSLPEILRFNELKDKCAHPAWKMDANANVFVDSGRSSLAAEQFRTLRSRLYQIRESKRLKTILVTSAVAGEGKTFAVSNLAQSLVRQRDRRVLIIDGDLRAPRQHTTLGAPASPGLSDFLGGAADLFSAIQFGPVENLCLIPGGSSRSAREPSDLLSGPEFKQLLDLVAPIFDWILIDSPPVVPVADASMMASHCDGVLVVVKANGTDVHLAQKACNEFLEKNLIGVVLNRVEAIPGYEDYAYAYGADRNSALHLTE